MNNSIIADLKFDEERGALLYNDVRYLLIRPETLIAFQKAAEETLGVRADDLLFAGGYTGGTLSAKKYREVFGLTDAQSVEFMAKMGTEIGWGKFTVSSFSVASCTLDLIVESSPFATAYGKSERGVCHLIRGVFAGLARGIFGREVIANEEECLAMGHTHCKFVIRGV
ncbi:MAG: XylR N-terminal domain-containing protein [Chloroflexi bacterium]|nr:XylR N-terminal domain-containing protein [Chloroflexota bacterium]